MERNDLATTIGNLILDQLDNEYQANRLHTDILRAHYEAIHIETSENIVSDLWLYLTEKQNELTDKMRIHRRMELGGLKNNLLFQNHNVWSLVTAMANAGDQLKIPRKD